MIQATNYILMMNGLLFIVLGCIFVAMWATRNKSVALIAAFGMVVVFGWGYALLPKPQVYEYHNVVVDRVIDSYTWVMAKDDGRFVAFFCHDYNLDSYQPVSGNVLEKFRYEDMGACWSVKRKDLGFWWRRDDNARAVILREN